MKSFLWTLFHIFMVFATGGLWLIGLVIWWFVTRNKR